MPGNRSYCFTINNYTAKDIDLLLDASFKYMIFGFETGKDKTPHIQGYIQFYSPHSFPYIKALMPRAHIEIAKGTPEQNIAYCSKDDEYYEFGEKPTIGGRVTYDQIKEAMTDPKNNLTIIKQYSKAFEQVNQLVIRNTPVKTKYYVIQPIADAITEINEYFNGELEDLAVITCLTDLAAYDNVKNIIFYESYPDTKTLLYPRGMPIFYKYGYETRVIKPDRFILVTDTPKLYPLFKSI